MHIGLETAPVRRIVANDDGSFALTLEYDTGRGKYTVFPGQTIERTRPAAPVEEPTTTRPAEPAKPPEVPAPKAPEAETQAPEAETQAPAEAQAPQKRPITGDELRDLEKRYQAARRAEIKAERDRDTPPEKLAAAKQKVRELQAEKDNSEGPPVRGSYVRAGEGPTGEQLRQQTAAHNARIDERVHAEGTEPVHDPKTVGQVFKIGGPSIVRGQDSAGNTWTGTGAVLVKTGTLDRAATQAAKLKSTITRDVSSEALEKVTGFPKDRTYEPVVWERQVTDPRNGNVSVIGRKPDGTRVLVQKPIFDALHAAAGKDGVIVAGKSDSLVGKNADDRLFARTKDGDHTGVGMGVQIDQARAKIWASGKSPDAAPGTLADRLPGGRGAEAGAGARQDPTTPYKDLFDPARARDQAQDQAPETGSIVQGRVQEVPRPQTPRELSQLEKLTQARERLSRQARLTPDDRARLVRMDAQIERLTRAERAANPDQPVNPQVQDQAERRGGKVLPFRPPQVGREKDLLDYKFNDGTSVWQEVFREAGHDPDLAVNRPIEWQTKILRQHMATKFGFQDVTVAGARGRDASRVDLKIARDAMLDMTRAMQDMAQSLSLPHSAMSLNGRLKLVIDPEGKVTYFGAYEPLSQTLRVMGGANSFGHEWTHATDHLLGERVSRAPAGFTKLLSQYTREGKLDVTHNVDAAFAKIVNTMFYGDAALAARRLSLETEARKVNKSGAPTKNALEAQRQLNLLDKGGSKLRITGSDFRRESAAFHPPKAGYYASVYEMLARAHEAYLAHRMTNAGVDPRGVVMPDEAYISNSDRQLKMAYPKQDERTAIFKAFDELHTAMLNEQILSNGKPPGGFSNYGASDPHHWPTTAPGASRTPLGQTVRAEINRYRQFTKRMYEALPIDRDRPKPLRANTVGERAKDMFKTATYSYHGMLDTIIARAPPEAQRIMRPLADSVAAAPGEGRYTGETFEEAVRRDARDRTFKFSNILVNHGLLDAGGYDPGLMTTDDARMLRHVLVTGESRMPRDPTDPSAGSDPIPANIIAASKPIRMLLDQTWDKSHKAGLDIGYARNGYFPRVYDKQRAADDPAGFKTDAKLLYRKMFDDEVGKPGDDPAKLLEKWTSMPRATRALATDPDLPGQMTELRKNLQRQAEIEANPMPTPSETAELKTLQGEAKQLATDAHDALRDHVADINGDHWWANLTGGALADFDTAAPSGKYLQARVLPPEADTIMRNWMDQDPMSAIPQYFHNVARRVAYAERFGPQGEKLAEATEKLNAIEGHHGGDTTLFMNLVADVTGRNVNVGHNRFLQATHNVAYAGGTLALMPRAVWSSVAEPVSAGLATRRFAATWRSLGDVLGHFAGTATARDRTALAHFLSIVQSGMHDNIMLSRMGADYSDSPKMDKLLSQFYRTTGLTQLTNAQRISSVGTSNWFLGTLAHELQAPGADTAARHGREDAARWYRELGIPDSIHEDFARFMVGLGGKTPEIKMLQDHPMGDAYSLAVRRLVDRIIQDPHKVDKPMVSSKPILGLPFQLMSFAYSFTRNILESVLKDVHHQLSRSYGEARTAGAGKIGATLQGMGGASGAVTSAVASAGALVTAQLMTTIVRQYLMAQDQWQKHQEDGDLGMYLIGLAFQRSGLNGTLDPLAQVATHFKYDSDLASLMHGATVNYYAKNIQDVLQPMLGVGAETNSNTAAFNQIRGVYNLTAVPLTALGLTMLGSAFGPATRVAAGAAMQGLTSPGMASSVAEKIAGPKGASLPEGGESGGMPKMPGMGGMPKMPTMGGGGGARQNDAQGGGSGVIPWGLVDDIAAPAASYLAPMVSAMPTPIKLGAAGLAGILGVAGAVNYYNKLAPYRDQPAPPRKQTAH